MVLKTAFCILALTTSPAWASCGGYEQTFLSCDIEGSAKSVSVCHDDEIVSYRFGIGGDRPELELIEPIATIDYTPWPGAGDTIWEEVVFSNQDYTYLVVSALRRIIPEDGDAIVGEGHFGGVIVMRGDVEIANLSCDPKSIFVDYMSGLSEAKNRLGLGWVSAEQAWVERPD